MDALKTVHRIENPIDAGLALMETAVQWKRYAWQCREPQETSVVLGRSSPADREISSVRCQQDEIPVWRRLGGGCSVVLTPGMVVSSLAYPLSLANRPDLDLAKWTQRIADTITRITGLLFSIRGVSDLCIGEQKVMGSCLYRSSRAVLYESSLLVNCSLGPITRYLSTPVRMPEYRQNRSHGEFLTTLNAQGYQGACDEIATAISKGLFS